LLSAGWLLVSHLVVLVVLVVFNSFFDSDFFAEWPFFAFILSPIREIPVLQGITFDVVTAIIIAIFVSLIFPSVWKSKGEIIKGGLKKVNHTVQIQLCAGIMVGVFYASGLIGNVEELTAGLTASMVKIGGAMSIVVVGMLTGSQTTAQSVNVTFLGPILENMNVDPTYIALGASHIAAAGQNMPPVGLTAFVVCGLIGGILN